MELIITTKEELSYVIKEAVNSVIAAKAQPAPQQTGKLGLYEAMYFLRGHGYKISKTTLYRLTSESKIPFSKFGQQILFEPNELLAWAEGRTKSDSDKPSGVLQVAQSARKKMSYSQSNK